MKKLQHWLPSFQKSIELKRAASVVKFSNLGAVGNEKVVAPAPPPPNTRSSKDVSQ